MLLHEVWSRWYKVMDTRSATLFRSTGYTSGVLGVAIERLQTILFGPEWSSPTILSNCFHWSVFFPVVCFAHSHCLRRRHHHHHHHHLIIVAFVSCRVF